MGTSYPLPHVEWAKLVLMITLLHVCLLEPEEYNKMHNEEAQSGYQLTAPRPLTAAKQGKGEMLSGVY